MYCKPNKEFRQYQFVMGSMMIQEGFILCRFLTEDIYPLETYLANGILFFYSFNFWFLDFVISHSMTILCFWEHFFFFMYWALFTALLLFVFFWPVVCILLSKFLSFLVVFIGPYDLLDRPFSWTTFRNIIYY